MRKLTYCINSTPDGRCGHEAVIADDALHDYVTRALDTVDLVLFARPSFELLRGHWPNVARSGDGSASEVAFARKLDPLPKLVFSRGLTDPGWHARVTSGDMAESVHKLKGEAGGEIIILGSPGLARVLREADLIDEYRIVIHPMLVSTGPMLFGDRGARLNLEVVDTTPFKSGSIAVHYARSK
jgi:dihydrofolate reductase